MVVFMLALLPFQFSWSAVATYCTHESTTSDTQHVGHHEHKHESSRVAEQVEMSGLSVDQFDADCWVCHGVGIGALYFTPVTEATCQDCRTVAWPRERLAVITLPFPDRPQWSAPA